MDRLDRLSLFLRVASTGSFSSAAREMGIGQPQASRAIANLEEELGTRLFVRTTRRLTLTENGANALPLARAAIEDMERLHETISGSDSRLSGRLRIAASVAHAQSEIVPHVGAFVQANPAIEIDLRATDARENLVAAGLDLAFRLGELEDASFLSRRLGVYERVLVADPGFWSANEAASEPGHLAGLPCVTFGATPESQVWTLSRGRKKVRIEALSRVRGSSGHIVLDLVKQGLGVALLPTFLVRDDLAAGRIVRVLPEWSGPQLALQAIWPAGGTLPRRARAFLDFIEKRLRFNQTI